MKEGAEEIGTKQIAISINQNPVTEEDDSDLTEIDEEEDEDEFEDADQTFMTKMKSIFSNPYFLLLCLSLSFLYYIITGI